MKNILFWSIASALMFTFIQIINIYVYSVFEKNWCLKLALVLAFTSFVAMTLRSIGNYFGKR